MAPPFPPVSSFTATFAQPGTYPYFCAIHPWMSGQVIVREEGGETENQATPGTPPTTTSPFSDEDQRQKQKNILHYLIFLKSSFHILLLASTRLS